MIKKVRAIDLRPRLRLHSTGYSAPSPAALYNLLHARSLPSRSGGLLLVQPDRYAGASLKYLAYGIQSDPLIEWDKGDGAEPVSESKRREEVGRQATTVTKLRSRPRSSLTPSPIGRTTRRPGTVPMGIIGQSAGHRIVDDANCGIMRCRTATIFESFPVGETQM